MSHRLHEADFTFMETFLWCRFWMITDKQRCYAHLLKLHFHLSWMVFILTRREQGLQQAVGNGREGSTKYLLSHPGVAQNWRCCCFFMPEFEVFLIQVSRSHWQTWDKMFSPCCFSIKTKMRFPFLCPVGLVFSIFKSRLNVAIIPIKLGSLYH